MELIAKLAGDEGAARRIASLGEEAGLRRFDLFHHAARATIIVAAAGTAAEMAGLRDALRAPRGELLLLGEDGADLAFGFGLASAPPAETPPGIEIVTRFSIAAGQEAAFREQAQLLTDLVRARDPGTARYDWFFSGDGRSSVALDTYADTAGMLAHMANAHALHAGLLDIATMQTEFLGDPPADAWAAVAKYDPFVLPRLE